MATPKVFLTGVTGYIGGDALHALVEKHPDWQLSCLVRNTDKGATVASVYPKIRLVYGNLDDVELLEAEARQADIILHFANADSVPAAKAFVAGQAARRASGSASYLIHTSGTGILLYPDLDRKVFGEASDTVWDDVRDIAKIREEIPDHAPHRNVDKLIFEAAATGAPTAIVCPPTIYGPGRGPDNRQSIQVPKMAKHFLQRGKGFLVGRGLTYWGNVNVHDLSDLYIALAESAAAGGQGATWGPDAYYFAVTEEHVWGDVSRKLAAHAASSGLLPSADVEELDADTIGGFEQVGPALWGANSRAVGSRARKDLGWAPKGAGIMSDEILDEVLQTEAKRAGIVKGHAAKAQGE